MDQAVSEPRTFNWHGRHVEIDEEINHKSIFVKAISGYSQATCNKAHKIAPMEGSANISVEKDSDGNGSVTVDVDHTSNDGSVTFTGEVKVDQDGNVSGKVGVGLNWDRD